MKLKSHQMATDRGSIKKAMVRYGSLILLTIPLMGNKVQRTFHANRPADAVVTEITLERTACFGPCPVYQVRLRSDGNVTYHGESFVPRLGTFTGTINPSDFQRLVQLMSAIKYDTFKSRYTRSVTDQPSVITSLQRGGKVKSVTNYGKSGPITLWGLERTIDSLIAEVKEWRESK